MKFVKNNMHTKKRENVPNHFCRITVKYREQDYKIAN